MIDGLLSRRALPSCRSVTRLAVIACLLAARGADAYRPFDGTDADVAETGEIELEIGPVQGERIGGTTTYQPGGVFNYGFAPSYEVVVDVDGSLPVGALATRSLVASDLLVKHVLRDGCLQDGHGPSLALETGVLFPSVPARGTDEAGWSLALIASQRWKGITVHLNVEGLYQRDREPAGFVSAIIEGPTDWTVRPVAELLVEGGEGQAGLASALGGVIWKLSTGLAFDGAVVTQREAGLTNLELRVGVTWAFAI